jgi:hypothetical protein
MRLAPEEEAMVSRGAEPAVPCKVKVEELEVVPKDKRLRELSQENKALALRLPAPSEN